MLNIVPLLQFGKIDFEEAKKALDNAQRLVRECVLSLGNAKEKRKEAEENYKAATQSGDSFKRSSAKLTLRELTAQVLELESELKYYRLDFSAKCAIYEEVFVREKTLREYSNAKFKWHTTMALEIGRAHV